jgi:hypothetical protein
MREREEADVDLLHVWIIVSLDVALDHSLDLLSLKYLVRLGRLGVIHECHVSWHISHVRSRLFEYSATQQFGR